MLHFVHQLVANCICLSVVWFWACRLVYSVASYTLIWTGTNNDSQNTTRHCQSLSSLLVYNMLPDYLVCFCLLFSFLYFNLHVLCLICLQEHWRFVLSVCLFLLLINEICASCLEVSMVDSLPWNFNIRFPLRTNRNDLGGTFRLFSTLVYDQNVILSCLFGGN